MSDVKAGRYRHFKGKEYEVLGVARHSENPEEELVVYRALYESEWGKDQIWVRPLAMFIEQVEKEVYSGPRFVYVGPME